MSLRVISKNVGAFYSVFSQKFIMPGVVKDTSKSCTEVKLIDNHINLELFQKSTLETLF